MVDNGIDDRHPMFWTGERAAMEDGATADSPARDSRIVERYDFTKLRDILTSSQAGQVGKGKLLDWSSIEDLLRMPEDFIGGEHGTHVAGIIGGRSDKREELPNGVCPDINIYDFRVFDDEDKSDEFTILAALQFIRHLNNKVDVPVIIGANLSLSIVHEVRDFACGATPVCKECDRLAASGVVVVAAAGNKGYRNPDNPALATAGYEDISITDPGNADSVITVGATHRLMPHTYGVSYFSSRGPTGDGRVKPDILAPGEKITSAAPGGDLATMTGTSMAAPHVSGVAALLLARYPEFMGKPQKVKEILMSTATDLKRERYFQGAGLVDALRALQSV